MSQEEKNLDIDNDVNIDDSGCVAEGSDASIPTVTSSDIEAMTPEKTPVDALSQILESPPTTQNFSKTLDSSLESASDLNTSSPGYSISGGRIPKSLRDLGVVNHFQMVVLDASPDLFRFLKETREDHEG